MRGVSRKSARTGQRWETRPLSFLCTTLDKGCMHVIRREDAPASTTRVDDIEPPPLNPRPVHFRERNRSMLSGVASLHAWNSEKVQTIAPMCLWGAYASEHPGIVAIPLQTASRALCSSQRSFRLHGEAPRWARPQGPCQPAITGSSPQTSASRITQRYV